MFFLFDVGGTKIRMIGADKNGLIGDPVIAPTPSDFEDGMRILQDTCRTICKGKSPAGIAGGLAGVLSRYNHELVSGSNIPSWVGKPIPELLGKALDAWVLLENDAALAGLGEAVAGAGRRHQIVGYMTISTGVGGARITNKKIDPHVWGFEPGNQIVDAGRSLCSRCTIPTLEGHISGSAIEHHYGQRGEDITDPAVWEDIAKYLALGLTNTIVHWSPETMVLGGSVMQSIPLDYVREQVKKNLSRVYPEIPRIERAQLGDIGVLTGAWHLAKSLARL